MRASSSLHAVLSVLVAVACSRRASAAELQILLPLGRTAYQTNETIDVSAVRSDARPLSAGKLVVTATEVDGSMMSFVFPVGPVAAAGGQARTTENLHLDGWLLRPGKYTIGIACDGARATTTLTVYSAVRKSTYKTIHWGGKGGDEMLAEGENGLGFNLLMTGDVLHQEPSIPAGADILGNALMGGGHQHDLRPTNDWSDPNVYLGAIQRGVDRALSFRTLPNAIGAHLHDEPGLTWLKNPHTHVDSPHDIAPQREAYERVFGHEPIWSDRVNVNDPAQYAQWTEENDFKLGLMDAFWRASKDALSRIKPGFLAVTQSQYGWNALFDGYYFNVARSLPIISGHGGYDDFGLRNLNPSFFLEMALPRQLDKPTWYMPEWYNISSDELRLEHNLSFITGIQGMSLPPSISVKSASAPAVVEENQLFQRIGTIFTVPEYTAQDVTILYSKSNQYYERKQGQAGLRSTYLATKLLQYPIQTLLEEDVLDGSLAANHKAVILTGISHLDSPVIAGLEDFVRGGGTVLATSDCTVPIRGMVRLPVDAASPERTDDATHQLPDLARRSAESARVSTFHHALENAGRIAAVLGPALVKAGIKPAFDSDVPTIAAGKQVRGEVEYDFAVNFTVSANDSPTSGLGVPVPATARISLPDDGRPVYDAVTGRPMPFTHGVATLAFGPGQMVALARPARAIGGVQVGAPILNRDFTREEAPLRLEVTASLVDVQQKLIAGNAPMEVRLTDPRGTNRYDVFRDAQHGVLTAEFPLAANDPAGNWTVTVTELLSGTHGSATLAYRPAAQCGALAGKTAGAVVFADDAPNIYKFFRDHRSVTIVPGSGIGDGEAARRLVAILKPYDVNATIESVADANKALPLSDEQAATWCGHDAAGLLNAAQRTDPRIVGYNVPGPAILIGNAADNPLITFLQSRSVLPYTVTADFPGIGHGLVSWNMMTLGHDIESVAIVGNDARGIEEAVGTAFRIGIGVDALTRFALPASSAVFVPAP